MNFRQEIFQFCVEMPEIKLEIFFSPKHDPATELKPIKYIWIFNNFENFVCSKEFSPYYSILLCCVIAIDSLPVSFPHKQSEWEASKAMG